MTSYINTQKELQSLQQNEEKLREKTFGYWDRYQGWVDQYQQELRTKTVSDEQQSFYIVEQVLPSIADLLEEMSQEFYVDALDFEKELLKRFYKQIVEKDFEDEIEDPFDREAEILYNQAACASFVHSHWNSLLEKDEVQLFLADERNKELQDFLIKEGSNQAEVAQW